MDSREVSKGIGATALSIFMWAAPTLHIELPLILRVAAIEICAVFILWAFWRNVPGQGKKMSISIATLIVSCVGLIVGGIWYCAAPNQRVNIFEVQNHKPEEPVTPASATSHPSSAINTIGNITNNQGIITQGQIGNNIINPLPPHDPNGIYQSDTKIGVGHGPSIDIQTGTISFQAISFTAFTDPTKPLEFQEYLLQCDGAPVPEPNVFVGTLSAMVTGARCKIVGKR